MIRGTTVVEAAQLASEIAQRANGLPSRDTQSLRRLRREYTRALRTAEPRLVIELAKALWRERRVHRFIGDELIANHAGAREALTPEDVQALGEGICSWDQVDCFALYIAGPSWRSGLIDGALVHRWAASPDRWWRRAALVSTVPLNAKAQGGSGDAPRTLAVCDLLKRDRDDMVVKALSWALRALSVNDPSAVRRFIESNHAALAPRVVREVENKLRTGLKNPRPARSLHET